MCHFQYVQNILKPLIHNDILEDTILLSMILITYT